MSFKFKLGVLAIGVMAATSAQAYQAGDIIVRAGAVTVDPQDSSSNLDLNGTSVPGARVSVDSNTQLGLAGTYMFTDHFGVGLLAATPFQHNIEGDGSVLGGAGKLAETKHLPPTLTLQYYPLHSSSMVQPYAGVGVNYTNFFEEKTTDTLTTTLGAASTSIELDDSVGVAAELGVDIRLDERFGLNAAVWWADIDTEATIKAYDGSANLAGTGKLDVEIDPLVYMVGFTYNF
ncbi:OmpW family protein [Marinobacter lacisalsi]|uniref:OmpW family protein n=1 Tax=Marinobacter lacisalsi TaxID=475979 RepID=A0ABV8QBW1_9GAMM